MARQAWLNQDIYKEANILTALPRFFGLTIVSFTGLQKSGKYAKNDIFAIIRGIVLFSIHLYYQIPLYISRYRLALIAARDLSAIGEPLVNFINIIDFVIAYAVVYIYKADIIRIFMMFNNINREINYLDGNYCAKRVSWWNLPKAFVLIEVVWVSLICVSYCVTYSQIENPPVLKYYYSIFIMGISWAIISYYLYFVNLGAGMYFRINRFLTNLSDSKYADISPYTTRKVFHCQGISSSRVFSNQASFEEQDVATYKLQKAAEIYNKIQHLLEVVTKLFSWQLLFLITRCFMFLVFKVFFVIGELLDEHQEAPSVVILIQIAYTYLLIHYLVHMCSRYQKQVSTVGFKLEKIVNSNISTSVTMKAEDFLLQTLHVQPEFYVCGLFPLNYTLIFNIIGSITSYVVILTQFASLHTNVPKI